ncbi:aldo/keto reductase [bacterium]|nr:aldo/keto reductase [bacterium]
MRQIDLGRTGIKVSELCLGTMTWGSQNTEAEGHAQMDLALERGVNFWDTAEMYPVNPVTRETAGRTEAIIGSWFAKHGGRDRVVLATKICGGNQPAVRDGALPTAASFRQAVEDSLRRLQTDWIDLYQIHWPARTHYHFRNNWDFDPRVNERVKIEALMIDLLQESAKLIAEGKIRALALSNETVWGTAKWLSLAERHGLPRVASVQNEYSLLCRQFDTDWSELSVMEDLPLMAFSPLACGILSGKYQGDVTPQGSRRSLNAALGGRMGPRTLPAAQAYLDIASRHGLDPCQMAIAFCQSRPFQTIPIVGATSVAQLANNLVTIRLSDEVLAEIAAAHRAHPQPY